MSRIQTLVSRPKRSLAALATVLIAVGITAASGANFNATTSANAANTFAAGTMSIGNSNNTGSTSILTASLMKPGDTTSGVVDITNAGTLGGTLTLSKGSLTDSAHLPAMSSKLDTVVVDCGAFTVTPPGCVTGTTPIYTGTLFDMGNLGHLVTSLGTFAPAEKHRYKFTVTLNASTPDSDQGASSTAVFNWNAIS
jgi:spore coat-associated protein N